MIINNLENEVWNDVLSYERQYQVSNYGRVRTIVFRNGKCELHNRSRIRKLQLHTSGYYVVQLFRRRTPECFFVHRLVAMSFLQPDETRQFVNHKDGVKTNNHAANLEWCTPKENSRHSILTGLHRIHGESNVNAKMDSEKVTLMRKCFDEGQSQTSLAKIFGLSSTAVNCIVRKKTWKHLLIFLMSFTAFSCSKKHYEDLTSKIKPLVQEPNTFTLIQDGKKLTATLKCEARDYERRFSYTMVFNGYFEVGRVEYIGAGVTERIVVFSAEGTLTSYYINHFSRYNP